MKGRGDSAVAAAAPQADRYVRVPNGLGTLPALPPAPRPRPPPPDPVPFPGRLLPVRGPATIAACGGLGLIEACQLHVDPAVRHAAADLLTLYFSAFSAAAAAGQGTGTGPQSPRAAFVF